MVPLLSLIPLTNRETPAHAMNPQLHLSRGRSIVQGPLLLPLVDRNKSIIRAVTEPYLLPSHYAIITYSHSVQCLFSLLFPAAYSLDCSLFQMQQGGQTNQQKSTKKHLEVTKSKFQKAAILILMNTMLFSTRFRKSHALPLSPLKEHRMSHKEAELKKNSKWQGCPLVKRNM